MKRFKYIAFVLLLIAFSMLVFGRNDIKYVKIVINGISLNQSVEKVIHQFETDYGIFDFPLERKSEREIEKVIDFDKLPTDAVYIDNDFSVIRKEGKRDFFLNRISEYSIEYKSILNSFPIFNYDEFELDEIKLTFIKDRLCEMEFDISSDNLLEILTFRNLLLKFLGDPRNRFKTSGQTSIKNKLVWEDKTHKIIYEFDANGFMEKGYKAEFVLIHKQLTEERFQYTESVKRKLENLILKHTRNLDN